MRSSLPLLIAMTASLLCGCPGPEQPAAQSESEAPRPAPAKNSPREAGAAAAKEPGFKGFTRLRRESFSCGGKTHSLEVYRCDAFASGVGLAAGQTALDCEFVLIPAGVYRMGGTYHEGLKPIHEVSIKPFLLARTELSQRVWDALGKASKSKDARAWRGPSLPLEGVSWTEAQRFLSEAGLRLPTESEWEYACRAATTTQFSFGESAQELSKFAWWRDNAQQRTQKVAGKLPNAFGLFDIHGNVSEWCQDTYQMDYRNGPKDNRARERKGARFRVLRGSAWNGRSNNFRSAYRYRLSPQAQEKTLGIRPAASR